MSTEQTQSCNYQLYAKPLTFRGYGKGSPKVFFLDQLEDPAIAASHISKLQEIQEDGYNKSTVWKIEMCRDLSKETGKEILCISTNFKYFSIDFETSSIKIHDDKKIEAALKL